MVMFGSISVPRIFSWASLMAFCCNKSHLMLQHRNLMPTLHSGKRKTSIYRCLGCSKQKVTRSRFLPLAVVDAFAEDTFFWHFSVLMTDCTLSEDSSLLDEGQSFLLFLATEECNDKLVLDFLSSFLARFPHDCICFTGMFSRSEVSALLSIWWMLLFIYPNLSQKSCEDKESSAVNILIQFILILMYKLHSIRMIVNSNTIKITQ